VYDEVRSAHDRFAADACQACGRFWQKHDERRGHGPGLEKLRFTGLWPVRARDLCVRLKGARLRRQIGPIRRAV